VFIRVDFIPVGGEVKDRRAELVHLVNYVPPPEPGNPPYGGHRRGTGGAVQRFRLKGIRRAGPITAASASGRTTCSHQAERTTPLLQIGRERAKLLPPRPNQNYRGSRDHERPTVHSWNAPDRAPRDRGACRLSGLECPDRRIPREIEEEDIRHALEFAADNLDDRALSIDAA
jgi:hypothetical protein